MRKSPRRGSRLSLECSCEGRVVDWAQMVWGDRLYVVQLFGKGSRCRLERHHTGARISVRARLNTRTPVYYDTK